MCLSGDLSHTNSCSVDVSGSLAQDIPPLFPAPLDLFREFHDLYQSPGSPDLRITLQLWADAFPNCADLGSALLWIAAFARFINENSSKPHFWREDKVTYIMFLALHHVLSLERLALRQNNKPELVMREVVRLTLVVFIGNFKLRLTIPRGGSINSYRNKVMTLMMDPSVDWSLFLNLRLWVLVVCGVGPPQAGTETAWYVAEIVVAMLRMGLTGWRSAMDMVREFIWIDEVATYEVQGLGAKIESQFAGSMSQQLS